MGEIANCADNLAAQCEQTFDATGRLAQAISGFVPRPQQVELATAIADAITQQRTLVAEAGTGTGKTFAYLVPCLLSGKKALISTATKTLQDQLFQKDLPMLAKALGCSIRVQNLKGRSNYLCRYRTELHAEEERFMTQQHAREILLIREKLPRLKHGERSELPEIPEDSPVWPYVTSTAENCLGTDCSLYDTCFLVKARRRALEANVVVINHHLYFADSRLKQDGLSELLPGVGVVVFDEAHQLTEIAENFYGTRVGTWQIRAWFDDLLRVWPVLDLPNQSLQQQSLVLDQVISQLMAALPGHEERLSVEQLGGSSVFKSAWDGLVHFLDALLPCFETIDLKEEEGVKHCKSRLDELIALLQAFIQATPDHIRWVERFRHHLVFHTTPMDVSVLFNESMTRKPGAYIFTSATLTMGGLFDCFNKPLGLSDVTTLLLPSPFDYQQQALLYLPRSLPDTNHVDYYDALLKRVLPVINACGGRCFFLFTSHRALKQMAQLLSPILNFPLLIQGEEAKPILLARFRKMGNAVLLGTATFWEGVDVKGEALSCVIIDKVPFASPADPVVRGKMAYYKSRGLSGFDELSLPNAVLALKQGVGRLIRDAQDKGVIMLADPRLTGRAYGRQIFASLPSMRKTRDEATVLSFIREWSNEVISD